MAKVTTHTLSREDMLAVIRERGSVLYGGQIITTEDGLPSAAALAKGDPEAERQVESDLQARIAALTAELNTLKGGTPAQTAEPIGEPQTSDDDLPAEIEAPEHLRKFGEAQGGHYTVRFEPFSEDPSQVWIEVSSVFSAMRGPFTVEHFSAIGKNITETCEFAIKRCKTFLEQFDTPGGTND